MFHHTSTLQQLEGLSHVLHRDPDALLDEPPLGDSHFGVRSRGVPLEIALDRLGDGLVTHLEQSANVRFLVAMGRDRATVVPCQEKPERALISRGCGRRLRDRRQSGWVTGDPPAHLGSSVHTAVFQAGRGESRVGHAGPTRRISERRRRSLSLSTRLSTETVGPVPRPRGSHPERRPPHEHGTRPTARSRPRTCTARKRWRNRGCNGRSPGLRCRHRG